MIKHLIKSNATKKCQASMEYLIIISLAVALIVPTFYLFVSGTQRATDASVARQALQVGENIIKNVNTVHSYGNNAKLVVSFRMPPGIQSIGIEETQRKTLIITTYAQGASNELVFFSSVNMTLANGCNGGDQGPEFEERFISPGAKELSLYACDDGVRLSFV